VSYDSLPSIKYNTTAHFDITWGGNRAKIFKAG
jgi:hypothetical protein